MKDGVIKDNLTDEEFNRLFEDSRNAAIKRRSALTDEERQRIDNDTTLQRWEGETEPTDKGEE